MKRSFPLILALALLATGRPLQAASETDAAAARALVKRYADAIVGIELVVTMRLKFGDREQAPREQRIEVNGTVISAAGLTVTSLAAVDPQSQFDAMRSSQGGGGRGPELVGTDFKEVKLRFADGKEVPARFVLKDADLDLAFMAPETAESGRQYPYVDLAQSTEGVVMNNYFFVSRAPKTLQRVPTIRRTEVIGIVEKPRRFYLVTDPTPALPVLDPEGRVLGISLQYFANGRLTGIVVLPSADIAEIAKQAVVSGPK